MTDGKFPKKTFITLLVGELIASALVCAVYLIIQKFTFRVPLGGALGTLVVLVNFVVMSILGNKVIDEFLRERGDGEMSEEQTNELVAKYQNKIQNQMKLSYIVRTLAMLVTLILAFLLKNVFDVIATLVPLLMFRPLITVSELIGRKRGM